MFERSRLEILRHDGEMHVAALFCGVTESHTLQLHKRNGDVTLSEVKYKVCRVFFLV